MTYLSVVLVGVAVSACSVEWPHSRNVGYLVSDIAVEGVALRITSCGFSLDSRQKIEFDPFFGGGHQETDNFTKTGCAVTRNALPVGLQPHRAPPWCAAPQARWQQARHNHPAHLAAAWADLPVACRAFDETESP